MAEKNARPSPVRQRAALELEIIEAHNARVDGGMPEKQSLRIAHEQEARWVRRLLGMQVGPPPPPRVKRPSIGGPRRIKAGRRVVPKNQRSIKWGGNL